MNKFFHKHGKTPTPPQPSSSPPPQPQPSNPPLQNIPSQSHPPLQHSPTQGHPQQMPMQPMMPMSPMMQQQQMLQQQQMQQQHMMMQQQMQHQHQQQFNGNQPAWAAPAGFMNGNIPPPQQEKPSQYRNGNDVYIVIKELGSGAFGTTFKVLKQDQQTKSDKIEYLALKVLKARTPEEKDMSYADIKGFLALPKSKHIIKFIDFWVDDMNLYLVMELCKTDLEHVLLEAWGAGRRPQEDTVRAYFGDILEGIMEVHKAGAVHGDLKPDNVLVRDDGTLCLADVGMSRTVNEDGFLITEKAYWPYLAPEAIHSNPRKLNFQTDMFAMGCVLGDIASGKVLCKTRTHEHSPGLNQEFAKEIIRDVEMQFPSLGPVIEALLSYDPEKRPSAAVLLQEIRTPPKVGFTGRYALRTQIPSLDVLFGPASALLD